MKKVLNNLFTKSLLSLCLITTYSNSIAQVFDGVDKATGQKIINEVSKNTRAPKEIINYVGKTQFPGMYIVFLENYSVSILTDKNAKFFMTGNYVDSLNNKNLTEEIKEKYQKIDISQIDKNDAIVDKKGNGKNIIYIMTDANCGFCQKLEKETISQLKNVTIYSLPVSILQPGRDMDKKVKTVLCKNESEQSKLWSDLLINKKGDIGNIDCKKANVLESNTQLMSKLKLNGTPTIIFPNGKFVPGWAPADILQKKIEENQK